MSYFQDVCDYNLQVGEAMRLAYEGQHQDALRLLDGLQKPLPPPNSKRTARRQEIDLTWSVWQKTGGLCFYCDEKLNPFDRKHPSGFQIDHVIPRNQGGSDDISNLVPSCRRCNNSKLARTPEQWRA